MKLQISHTFIPNELCLGLVQFSSGSYLEIHREMEL